MDDEENNLINLELEKIARLPMLDTNLRDMKDLTEYFVNQMVFLGHMELAGSFPVGDYSAEIFVRVKRKRMK